MREPTMNEHNLSDPKLLSLEARLAAMSPRATTAEQQKLLYECGFAAGRRSSARTLRIWQLAAAALVVVSLGLSIPLAQSRSMLAKQPDKPFVPTETSPSPMIAQRDVPPSSRQTKPVELDAWQVKSSAS